MLLTPSVSLRATGWLLTPLVSPPTHAEKAQVSIITTPSGNVNNFLTSADIKDFGCI